MKFEKFEHIGLRVSNMARSVAFYTDVIGMSQIDRRSIGKIELVFMELAGQQLELIGGSAPVEGKAGPIDHFGFTVSDLDAAKAHVMASYPEAEFENDIQLWEGCRCTFFRGPDGERLELFERRS